MPRISYLAEPLAGVILALSWEVTGLEKVLKSEHLEMTPWRIYQLGEEVEDEEGSWGEYLGEEQL